MKESTYQQKIPIVSPWLEEIISAVKKDLKQEHLTKDRTFLDRYFMGRSLNQVTNKELAEAYEKEIVEGNIGLAEFIATRWLLKNTDVYGFFEEFFQKITPDFEELTEVDAEMAEALKKKAIERFGAKRTFIFALFNSVVFTDELYKELQQMALEESVQKEERERALAYEKMQERYERKIAALTDRYEKKLSGFQRKYLQDTEKLKKQIVQLQKSVV